MKFFIFLAVMIWPTLACAQFVSIKGFCQTLPDYKQEEGVEHVSGADEGIVPADVNKQKVSVPDVIYIPVDVILAERFAAVKIPNDLELQPNVATISVHKDGRVEYNGQDITGQAYSLCGKSVILPKETLPLGNGQKEKDILSSKPEIVEVKKGIEGEVLKGRNPSK